MDDLDNAIEQTLKTNDKARMGATVADPLDAAVGKVVDFERAQQRAVVRSAVAVNPDIAAKANTLAVKNNLPHELVLRNMPEVLQRSMAEQIDGLLTTSPALAGKMRELPFAQMAHDSVDTLAAIEGQIRTFGEVRALRGPEPSVGSYASGVLTSVIERTRRANIGLSLQVNDFADALGFAPDPARRAELLRRYEQADAQIRFSDPEFKTDTAKGIYGGVSSTVSMLPATVMSVIARNPTPALAAMGVQTEADAYGKYRARGASAGEALVGGVGEGAVEVLTEKIPMGFLVDKFGKTGAKQFLAGMLLREVPSEQAATLLQDAIDTAVANPEKTWGDYLKERPGAAYETLLATLVQAGTMGGASAAVQKVAERAQRQQKQADEDGKFIGDLLANAADNKLRERDPSAFAALTQAAAQQHGAPTEVYIDANALVETLAQSGMTPQQIEAALPSAGAQITEAVVAGGDVVVPIGEFTALVAGSGMETQLTKHARLSPDALSQEDAKKLAQIDLKTETEKAMGIQSIGEESAAVRAMLLDQLTAAGRFSPSVNEAYADAAMALYETQAARQGISVQEFAQRYPLKVEGFGTEEGPRAFAQSSIAPTVGQVLDRTGQPMNLAISKQTFGADAKGPNAVLVELRDPANNERRGFIDFSIGEDGVLRSENTKVAPALRGRGLAEAMYQAARNAGYDIAPGKVQTEAGQAMVEKLQAKGLITKQTEGRQRAADVAAPLNQDAKGTFTPSTSTIALLAKADLSTFHHELGHFYLEVLADMASKPDAPATVVEDMNKVLEWFGIKGTEKTGDGSKTGELAQGGAEQAIRQTFGAMQGVVLGRPVPLSVEFNGRTVNFMARQDQLARGKNKSTIHLETVKRGRLLRGDPEGWVAVGYKLDGKDNLVPEGVPRVLTDEEAAEFNSKFPQPLAQDGPAPGPTEPVTPQRTPLETWRAMSLEQQRGYHEKFARGYEAYLFEGKAPSTVLSRAFQRFSEWMRSIYKSIRALNVEINDDIRRVYDRMLASEQAIKEAEAARAYAPLFADEKTIKEAGVDPAAYHALGAEATANAVDQLQARSMRDMRWLANAKDRALKALQKEAKAARAAIEAQVAEEVGRQPIYAAENFLRRGVLPDGDRTNAQRKAIDATQGMNTKLDLATLKEMYGDGPAAPWRYLATGKTGLATTKDGLHPDVVAEIFGFPSGDALVRELLAAEPQAQVIEGMTDQRMLEEHGELSSPEALERAAEQAIRNEARGKFIATELAALDKALGPARVLVKAAKDFAASVIGRKPITQIKPHLFAAAETRAAKLAEKSLGKVEEAATAKRNQLLNHYAARYAFEAQNEIARIREFFARVANTPDDRLKSRDMDVVNAARAVLAAYGVGRRGEAATEYLKKVAAYDPEMSGVLQGSVDAAMQNAKPLDELTLDELRALNDEVASLWHLAKRSRQMEVDGNLLDREEVQDELKARLDEIGIPDTMPGDLSAITPAETRIAKLKTYLASARRTEGWVEAMDGKSSGAFRSFIWQPVKEAADAYRADKSVILKKFRALLKPIEKTLTKRLIDAPELGYTFGKDTGGVAMNEILHAIAHTGNESNKRKLLLGRKWATELPDGTLDTSRWDAFINRLAAEGVLTKEHFDFVQGVWDLLEETKPLAQKTHRDVFGKYFAEVTADALTTPFGQYRGGYVPALADPRIVSDAKTRQLMEDENASMAFAFPSTNKGFTKGRVEYNRPLMLDLQTLSQHIDKVLLFGHMERPIRDVRRVLTSKGVAYGVNRIDPAAFDAIISPWLNRAARQQVTTPTPGHWQSWRLWSTLRNRAGMAAMFGNVVNAAQQVTGFSIAAVKVRPKYLLGAMADYVKGPREMANAVAEASPYMEGRMRNEVAAMNDQIKDILIDPSLYERTQQWTMRHAYFLQSAVDNVMSPVIWTAARNQALEQGQSEKEATRFADATVRQTQGSTLPEDISNFEAGSSFSRMFTQFAGYFNMQANLLGTEFQTISRDMGLRKGAGKGLYLLALGFLVPAWISELIVQAAKGGPDDEDRDGEYLDDWLAAVFGFSTLRGLTAMLPIFGQGVNAIPNAMNSKPYDDRLATSPAVSMIESAVKAPITVYKAAFEDGDKSKAVKDVASLISLLTGIPANIAARPLSYAVDVAEGDVQPTSGADAARGLATGRASPDSKR